MVHVNQNQMINDQKLLLINWWECNRGYFLLKTLALAEVLFYGLYHF